MLVELGNMIPTADTVGPAVTYMSVPEEDLYGNQTYEAAKSGALMEVGINQTREISSAADLAVEVMRQVSSGGGITHLPQQEAVLSVIAAWNSEGNTRPAWVWSDNERFAVLLGEFFGCPVGRPADVEQTHYTVAGPPGVFPPDAEALAAEAVANDPSEV